METAHDLPHDGARPEKYEFQFKEQMEVTRRLGLVWMQHLSASEFKIVYWLICNTVLRGHRSGEYSQVQICSGVRSRRGGMWAEGTGLSERIVRDAVKSLREKGLIHTEPGEWSTRFTVITSWNPQTGTAEESNVVALNLPRARRAQSKAPVHMQAADAGDWDDGEPAEFAGGEGQNLPVGGGRICPPSKGTLSNQSPSKEDCDTTASRPVALPEVRIRKRPVASVPVLARPGFGKVDASPRCAAPPPTETSRFDPRQSVAAAIDAAGQTRVARLAAARKKIDVRSYATTWLGAWGETYPGTPCPGWSEKVGGMLKKSLGAYWLRGQEHRVHDFLEWTVRNWDVILAAKLSWMRKSPPPALPCAEFVARFLRNFQEAWGEQEELKFRGTEPGQKQAAYALAKREGITIDVALARVIARDAAEKNLREVNEVAARAARDKRVAKLAADRGATRFTRDNPHPRAHENVRAPIAIPGGADIEPFSIQPITFNPDAFDAP